MKILIVDDEKVSLKKLQLIMTNFGLCDGVTNGISAIEYFERSWAMKAPYDIIMLDINLGEESGINILAEIRKREEQMQLPATKMVKIIMVTAHSYRETVTQSAFAGANGYIIKPFDKGSVVQKLRKLFCEWLDAA